jgi:hypothetical protein
MVASPFLLSPPLTVRDALPTVADVRSIYFNAQRKKNIIPQHANLTPYYNLKIVKLLEKISLESLPDQIDAHRVVLDSLLVDKKKYEDRIFSEMRDSLEANILGVPISIRLRTKTVDGRSVTTFNKTRPSLMLLDRFVALHLSRAFGIRSRGRDQCVRVLRNTFRMTSRAEQSQQGIIKLDIEKFYASIDHEQLIEKVDGHAGVPRFVKHHIRSIVEAYSRLNGVSYGIPDGVPSSAVLAEIYLENFDSSIRRNPDIALYLRYVDDIVIVCVPERVSDVAAKIDELLAGAKLRRNSSKSAILEHPAPRETWIEFLGYKFIFSAGTSSLSAIDISDAKLKRYLDAAGRMKTHADRVTCWALPSAVDEYLSMFQYLFRPHATAGSSHGMRIVTGLAYSGRFMMGKTHARPNFAKLVRFSQQEVGRRWGRINKGVLAGDTALCACCSRPIPRWDELAALVIKPGSDFEIMRSPALSHSNDDLRARIGSILWN